ncbi:lipid IV(A) 3-deoxy-D-manno-octulosonic acid transferase [Psychromonas ossibalaenae]|uniref:lipid IV(A) 3-deoxy-D-manno-octulosonic acid transferase n=1 Tax=Psychromonas ossibalaenae TaxID=444922 RepID=UPI000382766F|nr:lipid IV(A) 3-deoxy-D-manno-octulosonic acid transferase [Psychromonas ossibalaenae]
MLKFIYSLVLLFIAPVFLYSLYKKKDGKPSIGPRWKEHFGYTPALNSKKPAIWIHAVSVGEVIATIPLIKKIKAEHPEQNILITTTTSTGAEQAAKLGPLVEHRYMPLDFSFAIKRFIKIIQPQQLLIMETELWPNTLSAAAEANIPITIVNARLSERSRSRYAKVQGVFNLLSENITQILCQTKDDALRFQKLGIESDRVKVTGSIKFDINISKADINKGVELRKQIGSKRPVWIAASTHPGEDEQLFDAHKSLLTTQPEALLILVPRHPERFASMFKLSQESGFNTTSRSGKASIEKSTQVYLGDTMGEMLSLIQAADICFMAGSLIGDKVGGHNVLEPAALAKPILSGPSYYNFTDITKQLINNKSCTICADSGQITAQLQKLLNDPELRMQQGEAAVQVVNSNKGAIKKSIEFLPEFV